MNTADYEVIEQSDETAGHGLQGPEPQRAHYDDHQSKVQQLQEMYARKKSDHPTPFAKGTAEHDTTESGIVFSSAGNHTTAEVGAEAEEEYCTPPPGIVAVEKITSHVIQHFADENEEVSAAVEEVVVSAEIGTGKRYLTDDSALKFLPYETFSGRKLGYVFRLGSQGLGYYEDKYQPQNTTTSIE